MSSIKTISTIKVFSDTSNNLHEKTALLYAINPPYSIRFTRRTHFLKDYIALQTDIAPLTFEKATRYDNSDFTRLCQQHFLLPFLTKTISVSKKTPTQQNPILQNQIIFQIKKQKKNAIARYAIFQGCVNTFNNYFQGFIGNLLAFANEIQKIVLKAFNVYIASISIKKRFFIEKVIKKSNIYGNA